MFREMKMTAMAVGVLALGAVAVSGPAFAVVAGAIVAGAVVAGAVVVENDNSGDDADLGVSALQAQITAALSDADLSSDQLAEKIASIVSGAADPAAAAKLVISSAASYGGSVQQAVGNGLGKAAKDMGVSNPTASAAIASAVTTSGSQSMKTAYATTGGSTNSTNTTGGTNAVSSVPKKTTQQNSDTTGSPN